MSECNWSGCGHEGKIDGLCAKHHEMRGESMRKLAQADEQSCLKCGKKASEVKKFRKKRGMCESCAYYEKKKADKKEVKKQESIAEIQPCKLITLPAKEMDMINHPPHYTKGKIEVIDFIADQDMGYLDGNIIKYVARYRHKGSAVYDLKKAKWYLDKLIAQTEGRV